MNVSHCRQSQRRRFVSLNTTINIDFNHITLSLTPLMLCRFFFYSFLYWPLLFVPPMFAPHLTIFFFSFVSLFDFSHRFICLKLPMSSEYAWSKSISLAEIVYFEEMTMSRSRTFAAILIVVQGYDVLSLSSSQSILLINTREKEIYNRKQKNCNFVDSLTRSPTTFTVSHPKFIEIVAKEDSVKKGTYLINENKNNQRIASTK